MRSPLVAALLALLLTGCLREPAPETGDDTDADADTDADTDADADADTDSDSDIASRIAAHRAAWDALEVEDYDFVLQWNCFCDPTMTGPADMEVRGDLVTSATYVSDGSPVTGAFDPRTLDGLFDLLQSAVDRPADHVTATFDPEWSFPDTAYVDWKEDTDDEEIGFTVTDFTPIPTAALPGP